MTDFQLPGAENFSKYLTRTLEGRLTAVGPEVLDRSYDCDYTKRWAVLLDGVQIGEYFTYGPKPKEVCFVRSYKGRIPGYKRSYCC